MAKIVYYMAAVLCLICVIAICVAPDVDLPDTHLRSYLMGMMLMLCLIAGASYAISYIPGPLSRRNWKGMGSWWRNDHRMTRVLGSSCVLRC
jgi:hypothetical protein